MKRGRCGITNRRSVGFTQREGARRDAVRRERQRDREAIFACLPWWCRFVAWLLGRNKQEAINYYATANAAAELECSELITPNAVTLAEVPEDGWYLIAPYGEYAAPAPQEHTQVFGPEQAREVVSTFNSLSGKAARCMKNMWHGLGMKFSVPVFEGHSDRDAKRWPNMNQLSEIEDLRADPIGLWGMVTWNAAGLAKRTREFGPLKPSPIFWHEAKDAEGRVFPALLESVGLVRFPNISTAPVWTQNAAPTFAAEPAPTMDRNKLIKLLGLAADAADEQIDAALKGIGTTANALQTANAAKADIENQLATANTQLSTANGQVTTLTGERDTLTTTNSTLLQEREALIEGVLHLAEGKGAIAPAERPDFKTKLSTANSLAATVTELKTRKAMNTKAVELNGNRVDLSTANARADALQAAVSQRMAKDNCDYDAAFSRVKADKNFAPLFDAMQSPTKAAA